MGEDINQKLTGYNNSRGLQYIKLHLKKYDLLMRTFITPEPGYIRKIIISIDFACCAVIYGAGINDYFQYKFYKRRAVDRKRFIVGRKWLNMVKICNGKIEQELFDNKSLFNQKYKEFLGREWLDLDDCSFDEFLTFVKRYPKSMYKIHNGSGGNGIGIYDASLSEDKKADYEKYKKNHIILEEIIKQHKELGDFNPSSVNTMRLVTITNGEEVSLMSAVFRTGNGKGCTDNFHHYGLAALIDIKTGIVYTPAIDKKNQQFIRHPSSGKQITGFVIPYWDKIVNTVKEAACVTPSVRYVGWDVAIKEDGTICIIEGNCASDPDITQMPDQIGKWPLYEEEIRRMGITK